MVIWSYFKASFGDPGRVPEHIQSPTSQIPMLDLAVYKNVCTKCPPIQPKNNDNNDKPEFRWKPPRAYHCKVCKTCVFKMDHHCVWINNCVGARNSRFFVLFLIYT